ncbi:hypothetical protein AGR4A_pAt10293 [Agrobacterium tumefaciens str. B6]|uniref:Uncharacterized protein n=1 Tax=Agrobacterium tumefaciens str. B6 TaxID=1183423 RepID=A0A822V8J0_AGRTU|nr:hypothetical protein AGR4A_pAt10293 [Agrobacterium tumefaciens str. B6]
MKIEWRAPVQVLAVVLNRELCVASSLRSAARGGCRAERAEAAFLAGAILPELTVGFGGRRSSATGGAPSQRMIASRPGRSCFFSSAVNSASIPQA